jgi:CRISPR-associated endonuclease Csn1
MENTTESTQSLHRTILALDLGTASVGWALMEEEAGNPIRIVRTGARVFPAGVEGEIERGSDQSRAVARREARGHRRLLDRKRRRQTDWVHRLQRAGLLPAGDWTDPEVRHNALLQLDQQFFPPEQARQAPHVLLYRLRAEALDRRLTPHELGRALYHLAQRRGFLSNRKSAPKKDEKPGEIKQEIEGLAAEILRAGCRTLGEYFSRLDPTEARIRTRHTARKMYEEEFAAIWSAQRPHHPTVLTDTLKKELHRALFFQRPLKSAKHLIGLCDLEPKRRRAPIALLIAQRFRLLQKVNDLEITDTRTGEIRRLNAEERTTLTAQLSSDGDLSFAKIKKLLSLKSYTFNLERAGEKMIGNRTAGKLRAIFGTRWDEMRPEERDVLVEDVRSIQKEETLEKRAKGHWQLSDDAAQKLSQVKLEEGHCALSRQALLKVLPRMEEGDSYETVRRAIYGEPPKPVAVASLPALSDAPIPEIRNPTVTRTLSELRKVVNEILRTHGRPDEIRIELARDMKRGREEREAIWKKTEANRKKREKAAESLAEARVGPQNPRRSDLDRWQLYIECNRVCPYTGQTISATELFSSNSPIDVEHIIPFSRCLDDSFLNKTLCYAEENRNRKTNRTPWEAYGNTEQWNAMLHRVKSFQGDAAREKLRRFELKTIEEFEDFSARQLNDTRYATRLAVQYLNLLYGGGADGVDAGGRRRILAGRGQITAHLRNEYKLNSLLGDGGKKSRADHRHHAVDAIAIALADAGAIRRLSDAAANASRDRRRRFAPLTPPWPTFLDEAKAVIDGIRVSHRPSHKVNGALHDETIYSKRHQNPEGRECVHIRKPLGGLSKGDVGEIVDDAIRKIVQERLGGGDPKTVFKDPAQHPFMTATDGRKIPIHTVRIRRYDTTIALGQGMNERRVITGSNHHLEIIEVKDAKGRLKWEDRIVTTYEAMQRLRRKEAVVRRAVAEGERFVFSLTGGDTIEVGEEHEYFVVRTLSGPNVEYVRLTDARKKKDIQSGTHGPKGWYKRSLNELRKMNFRKVALTPLGDIRYAND